MAEVIKKKISDLDGAAGPLVGTELVELSVTGVSKKGAWSNLFGSGWWAKLAAAFSAFKAPDSDHADNADTLGVGLETPSDFHDAAKLTGAVPLASIPATLTGKTAEFAGTATNATNATTSTAAGRLNATFGGNQLKFTTTSIPAFARYLLINGSTISAGIAPSMSLSLSGNEWAIYI
jgi:hypothetical protein